MSPDTPTGAAAADHDRSATAMSFWIAAAGAMVKLGINCHYGRLLHQARWGAMVILGIETTILLELIWMIKMGYTQQI